MKNSMAKVNNLQEMDKTLKNTNCQEEIDRMNSSVSIKWE